MPDKHVILLSVLVIALSNIKANTSSLTDNAVRLVNASTPNTGLLQTILNDEWGYVCHADNFSLYNVHNDTKVTDVICRQLGYSCNGSKMNSRELSENAKYWFTVETCEGTETNIGDCPGYQLFYCDSVCLMGIYISCSVGKSL